MSTPLAHPGRRPPRRRVRTVLSRSALAAALSAPFLATASIVAAPRTGPGGPSRLSHTPVAPRRAAAKLRLIEVGSDTTAFNVIATAIVGPTEALLWDTHYHANDAARMADTLAALHKHLTAIIISHPDEDHVSGAAVFLSRFPGTHVYMTAAALTKFNAEAPKRFAADKARLGDRMADHLVTPTVLPGTHFTVDGAAVEVIPDLTGDVITPVNSVLWIPSLRAALVADVAFNGVHPWLGSSDSASRAAWRASLKRVAALGPTIVVAGHKRDISAPDSPAVLAWMGTYLDDFDSFARTAQSGPDLRDKMIAKYPDLSIPALLTYSAGMEMRRRLGATAASTGSGTTPVQHTSSGTAGTTGASGTLTAGVWTGTVSPPAGDIPITVTVGTSGGGTPSLTIAPDGHPSVPATNVTVTATTLSFSFQPGPLLACQLAKQDDGSYRGTCTGEGGSAAMVITPPR